MKNKKVLFFILILLIIFIQIISRFPTFIERYYSNGIYYYISILFRFIFGWIPFSVGDIFLLIFTFYGFKYIFLLFKNKFRNLKHKFAFVTLFLASLYVSFYFFWGLNYFREPLSKNLGFQTTNYSTTQLENTTTLVVDRLNSLHQTLALTDTSIVSINLSKQEIYEQTPDGFKNLAKKFPQFKYLNSSIKSSAMSLLQSYNGTSGYFNPFTGEAQVNSKIPKTTYLATTCHEVAHQLGFAAENEANFIGFLAAIHNNNPAFNYSGYRMAFGYLISEIGKRDKKLAKKIWLTVSPGIVNDFKQASHFWQQYKNPIEPLIKKGYNSYLKVNNQKQGIDSYNYVVDLLISYFNKEINT